MAQRVTSFLLVRRLKINLSTSYFPISMLHLLKACAAVVTLCCALGSASAQTLVVNPGGSIQSAVNAATPGTTIQVKAGVYTQKVLFSGKSGTSGRYITLKADPGVTLSGAGLAPAAREGLITIRNSSYVRVQGFNVQDFTTSGGQTPCGILVEGAGTKVQILHNKIHNIRNNSTCQGPCREGAHGLAVFGTGPRGLTDLLLESNEVYDNGLLAGQPLVVDGNVDRFEVLNNKVHDNTSSTQGECAICGATGSVRNGVVRGNTFRAATDAHAGQERSAADDDIPDWVYKPEGYQAGAKVKYKGNVFVAVFWASEPGVGDPSKNGWRLYDELYEVTSKPIAGPARIIGYIPTWRKAEGFNYKNEELYRSITHGIISFLMFSETNLGEFESKSMTDVKAVLRDVLVTGHKSGTYVSIALGGAVDFGFLRLMERVGNNPNDPVLQKAVSNVAAFVEANGLDGVDLDLECWWDKNNDSSKDKGGRLKSAGAHPAGKGLTLFAKELRKAMPGKLISAAVFATSWYGNCYDPGLAKQVDWLGIMTYDLTGSWSQSPVGPQTALKKIRDQSVYAAEQQGRWPGSRSGSPNQNDPMADNAILSVEEALWYWTNPFFANWQGKGQNLNRSKIAAGVPIYGYDFAYGKDRDDLSGQVAPGYKAIRYKDLLRQFPTAHTAANANIKVPGNTPRPPFVTAAGSYPYAHNIYFETPGTAVKKLNFLKRAGAQGVIIWELSNDVWDEGKSIIKALYKNSGNPATRPALPTKPGPGPEPGGSSFPRALVGIFPDRWSNVSLTETAANKQNHAPAAARATEVPKLSASPALVVYDDKLYCFHEGAGRGEGWLWYTYFNGTEWAQDTKTTHGITGTPAVAEYQGKLHIVHEGQSNSNRLWHITFDGTTWSKDTRLGFGSGSEGRAKHEFPAAALAVYKDRLYCVHEGEHGDGWLWYTYYDGVRWSEDKKLPNHGTSGAPALAVVDDILYCLHEGRATEEGRLMYTFFDGVEWSADALFNVSDGDLPRDMARVNLPSGNVSAASAAREPYKITGPPGLFSRAGQLYVLHQGRESTYRSLMTFNNSSMEDRRVDADPAAPSNHMVGSASATTYHGATFVAFQTTDHNLAMTTPVPNPVQYWNLLIRSRPASPYPAQHAYNRNLTASQPNSSAEFPVTMERHHFTADSRLRAFWNDLVERGRLHLAHDFLRTLSRNLDQYSADPINGMPGIHAADRTNIRALIAGIIDGSIQHRADLLSHDGFDNLATIYTWLPGNLFIGPHHTLRNDDPVTGFEAGGRTVMDSTAFQYRLTANEGLEEYMRTADNSAAERAAERAFNALREISQRNVPFPLNRGLWLRDRGGKYRLFRQDEL